MARCIFFVILIGFLCDQSSNVYSQTSALPDTVTAEQGEGIFAILRRSNLDPAKSLPDFVELNRDRLGTDSSLIKGFAYLIPGKNTAPEPEPAETVPATPPAAVEMEKMVTSEPLFGEKYEKVYPRDEALKGAVYYLVTGHSGPDPGAIGNYGPYLLSEDEYAYDVTLRLARRLMEHGATVYMIVQDKDDGIRDDPILPMDKDEVHYPNRQIPTSQLQRLKDRVEAVNNLYVKHKGTYQRMIALHIDSRSRTENIDVFFYHHANSASGKQLASSIHESFTKKYRQHQPNRKYDGSIRTRSSLYVVKHSYPPAVFIELGNIKNEKDQRRFVIPDNRQALANWITEGLLLDYSR